MSDPDWDEHVRSGETIGPDRYVEREYYCPDGKIFTFPAAAEVPEGSILIGVTETHKNPDGAWCGGYVRFRNVPAARNPPEHANHELVSADPLTISPSLACRRCPSHGFIESGRWRPA